MLFIKIFLSSLYLIFFIKTAQSSSIETCLSAQGINLTQNFDPNVILPIDCQCSNIDLICVNLKIFDSQATQAQLAFPTLSILFSEENSSLYYITPKQRLSFFGYKRLVANAFNGVKFVNTDNFTKFNNENIFIDFNEVYTFPTNTFSSFGNLQSINRDQWPRIYMTINT